MTTPFKPEFTLLRAPQKHALRLRVWRGCRLCRPTTLQLHVRNNEFNHANLKIGIDEAHALGKILCSGERAPHNSKLKTFIKDLQPVDRHGP